MPEPRYLLDSDTISFLMRHPAGRVADRVGALESDQYFTSVVVAGELRYGVARRESARLQERLEVVLSAIEIVPLDGPADEHYASIRTTLSARGELIGANDLWIAAHARSLDVHLVTGNVREFSRVPGLTVENWHAFA